jgi:RNA polymerase sigma-70 factor (ECF subfamily)
MTQPVGEGALIERAKAGSTGAFARLVDMHQHAVRAFLRRVSGSPADADDLAQETFLAAWQSIGRFDAGRSVRLWLMGIAYRKFLAGRRSWWRRMRRDAKAIESAEQTASPQSGSDARLDVARALACLPEDQRAATALCLAGDFTHAEAADILGLPLGTVKSHVTRGKAKLLAALGVDDGR